MAVGLVMHRPHAQHASAAYRGGQAEKASRSGPRGPSSRLRPRHGDLCGWKVREDRGLDPTALHRIRSEKLAGHRFDDPASVPAFDQRADDLPLHRAAVALRELLFAYSFYRFAVLTVDEPIVDDFLVCCVRAEETVLPLPIEQRDQKVRDGFDEGASGEG